MSTSSPTDFSESAELNDSPSRPDEHRRIRKAFQSADDVFVSHNIFLFLIAFRIVNALSIKTFFQPDEYFQSLEPAWQIAFGRESGAWITWEWRHHLRSAIHPYIFALFYRLSSGLSRTLQLSPLNDAELLIATPKIVQAIIAAAGDYYTWKLGQKVYRQRSHEAWAILAMTVCNPWQWFCSTRTFSNCLETTLTITALYLWPWHWSLDTTSGARKDSDGLPVESLSSGSLNDVDQRTQLRRCLLLAALACVLRPTNLLIWICLSCFALFRIPNYGQAKEELTTNTFHRFRGLFFRLFRASWIECKVLICEATLSSALILAMSATTDRLYYREWTFPPLKFFYFNLVQSLAVHYGMNRRNYYLTEGYPLLLTTLLPFTVMGLKDSLWVTSNVSPGGHSELLSRSMRYQLATTAIFVPLVLSLVSHKEVRFIYPLLPILHVVSASSITTFFRPIVSSASSSTTQANRLFKYLLLSLLLAFNVSIAIFGARHHQTAPLSVMTYLRHQYVQHYLSQPPEISTLAPADTTMTVGFLMPCHSTPWRSHLIYPGIKAWALSCEPPVNKDELERVSYLDEADQFYDRKSYPKVWLAKHIGKAPQRKSFSGGQNPQQGLGVGAKELDREAEYLDRHHDDIKWAWDGKEGEKMWPEYLVFFEQLEPTMAEVLKGTNYTVCWRGWNSWFHDDWRRRGDVLVWCLRGDKTLKDEGRRKGKGKEDRNLKA